MEGPLFLCFEYCLAILFSNMIIAHRTTSAKANVDCSKIYYNEILQKSEKYLFTNRRTPVIICKVARGISAVGSAPQWHCGGQEFDSPMLHQKSSIFRAFFFFTVALILPTNPLSEQNSEQNQRVTPASLRIWFIVADVAFLSLSI